MDELDVRQKNMKRVILFLVFALLASCKDGDQAPVDVVSELMQRKGYWKLAGADAFADGGTYCLSFMTQGRIVHVAARPNSQRKNGKLVFELWHYYNDPASQVIEPNSALEASVLWLLENYEERPEIKIERDYAKAFSTAIKDRSGMFPIPIAEQAASLNGP